MSETVNLFAEGSNQTAVGKEGVTEIIKSDIREKDLHFWVEASGAIEHYFKKYNGYPMPNILSEEILSSTAKGDVKLSDQDNVHYSRQIGGEWFNKMIFGVKSEDIMRKAIEAVDNYTKFMEEVNSQPTINEGGDNGLKYTVKQAVYIVENILRNFTENYYYELIPEWKEALQDCLKVFQSHPEVSYSEDYIEYIEYLLNHMPVLELHPLNI